MPRVEEYESYIRGIWQRQWLTNNGPLVNELELQLKQYLQVPHMIYVNNGSAALQIAIKSLGLTGEIITTPFSFIATTSSILWEGWKPVFVDIDPNTLNIDPALIEAAITPQTSAILATHVFGNPCDIDAIQEIATRHNLKVIYDAAHCFGTKYKGQSVFQYGDISITSFHATKLFHTIEGGAVFTQDANLLKQMAEMRNFGFSSPEDFACIGINGKNSEFHAAMGLVNLKYADDLLQKRKSQYLHYADLLQSCNMQMQTIDKNACYNHSYFPIILPSEEVLKKMEARLIDQGIYARRYFYPSLHTLRFVEKYECNNSLDIAQRILCLPMHHELTEEEMHMIVRILLRTQNN
jgi:dTDP-4-amino-4,6-dideoxygalactose transaminase